MVVGLLMLAGGAAAGLFGSLLGLGGGILIVPLLTLGFGLPLRDAVGVSLVSVIMTSSAAAGVYLERRVANLRLGMTLELFTAIGALVGGSLAFLLAPSLLEGLFAVLLLYVAFTMLRAGRRTEATASLPASEVRPLPAPTEEGEAPIGAAPTAEAEFDADSLNTEPRRLAIGVAGSFGAGIVSALLGIGGGLIKVPLMHLVLRVPMRVATATSNLMIGITAAASAVIYALNGGIDPYIAGPTAIGVFLGATLGSRVAHRIQLRYLRWLFVVVLVYTAVQMLLKAVSA